MSEETKAGNAAALRRWYEAGGDGQINWGTPGDFMQCVRKASQYMTAEQAKGFCAIRHRRATGNWPGQGHKSLAETIAILDLWVRLLSEAPEI